MLWFCEQASDVRSPASARPGIRVAGWLAVDGTPVAPEAVDAWRDSPGEVVPVRVSIMATVAIVRLRRRWRRRRVFRNEIGDVPEVDDNPVPQNVLALEVRRQAAEGWHACIDADDFILGDVEPYHLWNCTGITCPSRELERLQV